MRPPENVAREGECAIALAGFRGEYECVAVTKYPSRRNPYFLVDKYRENGYEVLCDPKPDDKLACMIAGGKRNVLMGKAIELSNDLEESSDYEDREGDVDDED